jgi:hypothetical protein
MLLVPPITPSFRRPTRHPAHIDAGQQALNDTDKSFADHRGGERGPLAEARVALHAWSDYRGSLAGHSLCKEPTR